jgi:hypothetical protein
MVRTAFSFANIDSSSHKNVGALLHRQLIIFLNAILVEEVMENNGTGKLNLKNPTKVDKIFVENYKNNIEEEHPLFDFMFSCPLIQAYLNLENPLRTLQGVQIGVKNVYRYLSRLDIKDVTRKI